MQFGTTRCQVAFFNNKDKNKNKQDVSKVLSDCLMLHMLHVKISTAKSNWLPFQNLKKKYVRQLSFESQSQRLCKKVLMIEENKSWFGHQASCSSSSKKLLIKTLLWAIAANITADSLLKKKKKKIENFCFNKNSAGNHQHGHQNCQRLRQNRTQRSICCMGICVCGFLCKTSK